MRLMQLNTRKQSPTQAEPTMVKPCPCDHIVDPICEPEDDDE
jgi:hypothetical protein